MASDRPGRSARPGNNGGDRLLALLQVTNAAFPTGAFTQSYGFETWIADGTIATAVQAEMHCLDWLRFNVATCDAAAAALAHRRVMDDDLPALAAIEEQLGAIKLSRESRAASLMTGAALNKAGWDIFALDPVARYARMVREGTCEGHHAIAYVLLSAALGFTEAETVTSFLWTSLSSLVAVVQRLVPLGQAEAQRIIAKSGPLIERCTDIARTRDLDSLTASYAALDAASMRHERLGTRLCIS